MNGNATRPGSGGAQAPRRRRVASAAGPDTTVVALDQTRIARALELRERYRYVQPRVERDGEGWRVVSPNCSRNIDSRGGEIDIARFLPDSGGRWRLYSRDHTLGVWVLKGSGLSLMDALQAVCEDPRREFWK